MVHTRSHHTQHQAGRGQETIVGAQHRGTQPGDTVTPVSLGVPPCAASQLHSVHHMASASLVSTQACPSLALRAW
jgi:hypothetical protein